MDSVKEADDGSEDHNRLMLIRGFGGMPERTGTMDGLRDLRID